MVKKKQTKNKSLLFRRIPVIKDVQVVAEIKRAHLLISLLSVSLIAMLAINLDQYYKADPNLSIVAIILLAVLGIISMGIVVGIDRRRR